MCPLVSILVDAQHFKVVGLWQLTLVMTIPFLGFCLDIKFLLSLHKWIRSERSYELYSVSFRHGVFKVLSQKILENLKNYLISSFVLIVSFLVKRAGVMAHDILWIGPYETSSNYGLALVKRPEGALFYFLSSPMTCTAIVLVFGLPRGPAAHRGLVSASRTEV
jgi:hypothetical protein